MNKLILAFSFIFSLTATATPCGEALAIAPSAAEIENFVKNLVTYADDLTFDAILFIREFQANEFHAALTPEFYKKSWSQPVPAGPLALFQGHLFPRDFYRSKAYSPRGQERIDDRAPHLIGKEQWAFDITKGTFTLEKGRATEMLMNALFQGDQPIVVYRGVRNSEADRYKKLNELKQNSDAVAYKKFIAENFKPPTDPAAGCFTTPSGAAAKGFSRNNSDSVVAVFKIDPKKLTPVIRSGIYVGVESDYFEIAFSSAEAYEFMIHSFEGTL